MDAVIVVEENKAYCKKLREVKKGDNIVCGISAIKVVPEFKERDRQDFEFMSNEVSSEKRVEILVKRLAKKMKELKKQNKKIVFVAGPVVVHTGGSDALAKLIKLGYVSVLLSGNALAVHDIENALYGTSLGIDVKTGVGVNHGHKNHMRAINAIYKAGSMKQAVEKGVLKTGIMYECIKNNVDYVLAASLRDDGPLPEVYTDMLEAQDAYSDAIKDAEMAIMLSTMLHSIGTGNMLPGWVKTICVDINPAVVTKLADRGSMQTIGVVTDVGLFLKLLIEEIENHKP